MRAELTDSVSVMRWLQLCLHQCVSACEAEDSLARLLRSSLKPPLVLACFHILILVIYVSHRKNNNKK